VPVIPGTAPTALLVTDVTPMLASESSLLWVKPIAPLWAPGTDAGPYDDKISVRLDDAIGQGQLRTPVGTRR